MNRTHVVFQLDHETRSDRLSLETMRASRVPGGYAIRAGEVLKGSIQVRVANRKLPRVDAPSRLTFVSREMLGEADEGEQLFNKIHVLYETSVEIDGLSNELDIGPYVFPFEIAIPEWIPSSMTDHGKVELLGTPLWMHLENTLHLTRGNNQKRFGGATPRHFMVVANPPPPLENSPFTDGPTVRQFGSNVFMGNKNKIVVAVKVSTTNVMYGDPVQLSVACRNLSSSNMAITKIQIALETVLNLRPSPNRKSTTKRDIHCWTPPSLPGLKLDPVRGGITEEEACQQVSHDLLQSANSIPVPIRLRRGGLVTHYDGTLFTTTNNLCVRFMGGRFGKAIVEIPIPLQIRPSCYGASSSANAVVYPVAQQQQQQDEIPLVHAVTALE